MRFRARQVRDPLAQQNFEQLEGLVTADEARLDAAEARLDAVEGALSSTSYAKIVRTTDAGGATDYTSTSAAYVPIDSVNLRHTRTCSGRPVRLHLRGVTANNVAMGFTAIQFRMDGAVIDTGPQLSFHSAVAGAQCPLNLAWDVTPTPGSHYFEPWWSVGGGGTSTLYARTALPIQFLWEELPYG